MAKSPVHKKQMNDEIAQATEQAKQSDAKEPRATTAHYNPNTRKIEIELRGGAGFSVPTALIQGLGKASRKDLENVTVTPSGEGLRWRRLDVDLSLPSLLQGVFGTRTWMAQLGSIGGRVSSSAKAAAARANGQKGGRPRVQHARIAAAARQTHSESSRYKAAAKKSHTKRSS
jgi:hypothetical protein